MESVVIVMAKISDSVQLLFETSVEEEDGQYVVPIPSDLVENGSILTDHSYRVALIGTASNTDEDSATEIEQEETAPSVPETHAQGPPVEEGEIRTVRIDTLGDQGDGIAKVERGFIVIVPGTKPGDKVEVEITDVKDTVAFAETVGEATVR
jgi:predicted RNA-binding protein with TRAM domain